MNKQFFLSGHLILVWITIFLLTSSCSLVESSRRKLLGDEKASKEKSDYVNRAQYDQLMSKYEKLSVQYDELKRENSPISPVSKQGEVKEGSVETVDVFENLIEDQRGQKKDGPLPMMTSNSRPSSSVYLDEDQISEDVLYYNKAVALKENGELKKSLQAFQVLSKSDVFQVKVRAMYQMGRIFMINKEYDLAMQMFEEILNNHASSGVVIKSLRSLVECSQALGLKDKKRKYSTILRDIFDIS